MRQALLLSEHLLPTALADALAAMDESPWSDYYGKPITTKAVASLLAPYGITSKPARLDADGKNHRYYSRSDFEDAWSRYLSGPESSVASVASETAFAFTTAEGTAIADTQNGDLTGDAESIFGDTLEVPHGR